MDYHPSFGVEVMTTTMTVASGFGGYGYYAGFFGDLSQKTFQRPDLNGYSTSEEYRAAPTRERTVTYLLANPTTPAVAFGFSPGWTTSHGSAGPNVLHVCDETFSFSPGGVEITADQVELSVAISADWSRYATREVRLYFDRVGPEFASARVDGSSLEMMFSEPLSTVFYAPP